MGHTYVTTTVSRLANKGRPYEAQFLVETGAIDCLAPASRLKAAGIKPAGRAVDELADGSSVEMAYGFARISFIGSETVAQIIFGPEGAKPILGLVALGNTGIMVDPASRKLRRRPTRPLK